MWIAQKTLDAINEGMHRDGGNLFRAWQGHFIPQMHDAFRSDEDGYRSHLGASIIGKVCDREIWYGWRWAYKRPPRNVGKAETDAEHHARMLRLWNRGHLEEGRFLSMLAMIGVVISQYDANGKQWKIADHGGHFQGSTDSLGWYIPDLPHGIPALLEFKTHGEKSYLKLVGEGVHKAKPEHVVQMQVYMRKLGLQYGLYMGVNKNTDAVHPEIVPLDTPTGDWYLDRARRIIYEHADVIPPRHRRASPTDFNCRYCDVADVCYSTVKADANCRTCAHGRAYPDGTWRCRHPAVISASGQPNGYVLDKATQRAGCGFYVPHPAFK